MIMVMSLKFEFDGIFSFADLVVSFWYNKKENAG